MPVCREKIAIALRLALQIVPDRLEHTGDSAAELIRDHFVAGQHAGDRTLQVEFLVARGYVAAARADTVADFTMQSAQGDVGVAGQTDAPDKLVGALHGVGRLSAESADEGRSLNAIRE